MGKDITFTQKIDTAQIVTGQKVMSICDIGPINKETGNFECINQRDWTVPDFSKAQLATLCGHAKCDDDCATCIITRILEEL